MHDNVSNNICNHGICVNTVGSFECYCKPGYTGEWCDLDFDECLSTPCQNNAKCLNKVNNYECVCTPGYTGMFFNQKFTVDFFLFIFV